MPIFEKLCKCRVNESMCKDLDFLFFKDEQRKRNKVISTHKFCKQDTGNGI